MPNFSCIVLPWSTRCSCGTSHILGFSCIQCGVHTQYYIPDVGGIRYSVWYSIYYMMCSMYDILHTPCGGAMMPLSTIFQVFQVVHITFHVVRISGVPCCTTKNITSVLKLSQKSTLIVLC